MCPRLAWNSWPTYLSLKGNPLAAFSQGRELLWFLTKPAKAWLIHKGWSKVHTESPVCFRFSLLEIEPKWLLCEVLTDGEPPWQQMWLGSLSIRAELKDRRGSERDRRRRARRCVSNTELAGCTVGCCCAPRKQQVENTRGKWHLHWTCTDIIFLSSFPKHTTVHGVFVCALTVSSLETTPEMPRPLQDTTWSHRRTLSALILVTRGFLEPIPMYSNR